MKQISIMLKPASSLCNLRCKYCFYADVSQQRETYSHGIMSYEALDAMLSHIFGELSPGDRLDLAFQGGEPTLAGLDFFRHCTQKVSELGKGIDVNYALQTNGILLDDSWAAFLAQHHFLVGLSWDGPSEYHNAARVDTAGQGTYKQILSTKKLLERHNVPYNILTVLTRQIARHPQAVWKWIKENKIAYIQFIPCLAPLEADKSNAFALEPEAYASFYKTLFHLWFEDFKKGQYTSVKLFDDIVNQLAFGMLTACGQDGQCRPQIVVEADGSVYPCDFYALDRFCLGNLVTQPLAEIALSSQAACFRSDKPQEPALCQACRYQKLCGGGCKRMRHAVFCDPKGKICGYQALLDACFQDLCRVAQMQQRLRMQ